MHVLERNAGEQRSCHCLSLTKKPTLSRIQPRQARKMREPTLKRHEKPLTRCEEMLGFHCLLCSVLSSIAYHASSKSKPQDFLLPGCQTHPTPRQANTQSTAATTNKQHLWPWHFPPPLLLMCFVFCCGGGTSSCSSFPAWVQQKC